MEEYSPIQEVRSEVDHNWQLGKLLQQLPRSDGRVVGGAARDQDQASAATDLGKVVLGRNKKVS